MDFISVASVYPTMKSATNPYMFSVGGTNITGTSGQNIDDLLRNTRLVCLLLLICNSTDMPCRKYVGQVA